MGDFHRALVFQGGGALGAYEAGTYQQVYRKASKESTDGRLFDNSWEGSAERLLEFWEGLMCPTVADGLFHKNSLVRASWDYLRVFNREIADAESARRFWSIFEFAFSPRGVTNMYRSIPHMGSKFLNPFTDFLPWWRYDYTPLRNYLSKFIDFPIKTSLEKGQPRLLLTSVDIQDFTSPSKKTIKSVIRNFVYLNLFKNPFNAFYSSEPFSSPSPFSPFSPLSPSSGDPPIDPPPRDPISP